MSENIDYVSGSAYRCKPSEFAKLAGVTVKTLQRWDKAGTLVAGRLPSGRRFYTERHYGACGGDPSKFLDALSKGGCRDA